MAAPRIKICGITNVADAVAVAELGADAIGLNFYPESPRHVGLDAAARILANVPPFLLAVAVSVNESLSIMVNRAESLGRISIVQWHGNQQTPGNVRPFRLIPAFNVKDQRDLDKIDSYLEACRRAGFMPDGLLLDAHAPDKFGGTGQTAPWELLAAYKPGIPIILAGGLTPENVVEAIKIVRPYAVDVAGGVESRPGVKDREKMSRFIERVRSI